MAGWRDFIPKKAQPFAKKAAEELTADPQKLLLDYHKRSNVEGSSSILKRDNPLALRKKLDERQEQEAFDRACNQNLKRLCYLNYTKNIDPKGNWPK